MLNACRPLGRLFYWFVATALVGFCIPQAHAAGPATTTVVDTVYRADGSTAQGTLLISWPAFAAKNGEPVAAGSLSVKIGTGGAIRIPLVPNAGATPAGSHYKVVLKLDDGTTDTEYWSIPDTSTTTVAAIRSKIVPASVAAQFVSRNYVDGLVAGAVHTSGDESIGGKKSFTSAPQVPSPANVGDAANKEYVDEMASTIRAKADESVSTIPNGSQTIVQPSGTRLSVNRISAGSLNGMRMADQFSGTTAGEKAVGGCNDLAGSPGLVVLTDQSGSTSDWTATTAKLPENCTVEDVRGLGGPNEWGDENQGFKAGAAFRRRITANTWSGYSTLDAYLDASTGGLNGDGSTKTDYSAIRTRTMKRTQGQGWGIFASINNFGDGDTLGGGFYARSYGTNREAGGEGVEGVIASAIQGSEVFLAAVAAKSANTITYSGATNASTLGELRYLIKTNAPYSTGTVSGIAFTSNAIVTGVGSSWATQFGAGIHDDLYFAMDGANAYGSQKSVVKVKSVDSNTQLTLDIKIHGLQAGYPSDVSSGTYKIFKGSQIQTHDLSANTITVADASMFAVADSIEAPLGQNVYIAGLKSIVSSVLPPVIQMVGAHVVNVGTRPAAHGIYMAGAFGNFAQWINDGSFRPGNFADLYGHMPYAVLNLRGTVDNEAFDIANVQRNSGSNPLYAHLGYDKSTDQWTMGSLRTDGAGTRFAVGTNLQAGYAGYIYYNDPASSGVIVTNNSVPSTGKSLLDLNVQGHPQFRVEKTATGYRTFVNEGGVLLGFSGNQSGQTWSADSATGKGTFTSLTATDANSTVDGTQVVASSTSTGAVGFKMSNSNNSGNPWQFFISNANPPLFKIGQAGVADYLTVSPTTGNSVFIGKLTANGGVVPSSTSSTIAFYKMATHAALDLANVSTGGCSAETTESITGALPADACEVSSATALEAGGFLSCKVTAADTVKWQLCNLSGGAIDRASTTYTIRVIR